MLQGVLHKVLEARGKERAVKDFIQMVNLSGLKPDLLAYGPTSSPSVRFISWITKAIVPFYVKKKMPGGDNLGRILKAYNILVKKGEFSPADKALGDLVRFIRGLYHHAVEGSLLEGWGWVERIPYDGVNFSGVDGPDEFVKVKEPIPSTNSKSAPKRKKRKLKLPPKKITEGVNRARLQKKLLKTLPEVFKRYGAEAAFTPTENIDRDIIAMPVGARFSKKLAKVAYRAKTGADARYARKPLTGLESYISMTSLQWDEFVTRSPRAKFRKMRSPLA